MMSAYWLTGFLARLLNNDAKISEAFKAITNVLILKRPGNTRTPLDRLKSANTDLKDRIQNLPTRTHYA